MIFLLFVMTACVASTPTDEENNTEISEAYDNKVKKYMERAELTDVEKDILRLVGIKGETKIYNFYADENLDSIDVNFYVFENGKWGIQSESRNIKVTDAEGRICLAKTNFDNVFTVTIQTESDGESSAVYVPQYDKTDEKSIYISNTPHADSINYGNETVLQIVAIGDNDRELPIIERNNFYETEPLGEYDDTVAVTVRFNEKTKEVYILNKYRYI